MQVGDLVTYIVDYGDWERGCLEEGLIGIVVEYDTDLGCYSVQWNDGSYDEDLVYGELEVICK